MESIADPEDSAACTGPLWGERVRAKGERSDAGFVSAAIGAPANFEQTDSAAGASCVTTSPLKRLRSSAAAAGTQGGEAVAPLDVFGMRLGD